MPKYRLADYHYLNDQLRRPDTTMEFEGTPSMAMVPLDKEAKERCVAADAEREQRRLNPKSRTSGWTPASRDYLLKTLNKRGRDQSVPMSNMKGRRARDA